ncbi:hypothetical protein ACHQM5_021219 [Ranunculus cassubicifolius]
MMPPEIQTPHRPHRPISSLPTFSTFNAAGGFSPEPSPNSNFNSRSKNPRFSASTFLHNNRIAIGLLPCAAFLLDLGGTPVVATLTLGLMISYILDSLSFKSGSFFGIWFSLLAAQIAFFFTSNLVFAFTSWPIGLLACLFCAKTTFLIGVWASLQFKWIQIENPTIVLALERLLFACVPITSPAMFTWATVSAVGMVNASYYLMAFCCVFYWLFSIPRVSSFKSTKEVGYHGGEVPDFWRR